MDRIVMLELTRAIQARANLAAVLSETNPDDRDFLELLALVRDSRLLTVGEIAKSIGLSRSRTYELLAEADADREQ